MRVRYRKVVFGFRTLLHYCGCRLQLILAIWVWLPMSKAYANAGPLFGWHT